MARGARLIGGMAPGFSRLASALAGGQGAYQQAYDGELQTQSRLAQAMAAARAADANAEESLAKADYQRGQTRVLDNRPALVEELIAGSAGTDAPMVRAIRQFIQTGQRPQVPMGPETADGEMGVGSQQFDPTLQSKVAQQLSRLAPVLLSSDGIKVDDWAKAQGLFRDMDLGDQVLNGQRQAGDVGRAQAAVGAKPLYNSDPNGAVLDLFLGGLDTSSPIAQGTIAVKNATADAQRANAVQSYASADASNASAARTRAEMADGVNRGGSKAPAGYRWQSDGVTLEPIPGGPADPNTKGAKQSKPPTEGQAKALMFGSRMAVADEVLNELSRQGVNRPGNIKAGLQGVAGAVPLIGDSLSAGVGAATNWTQSGGQQRVEQAQRDFINAVLRRESGAVITPEEFANAAQQYFPQIGDTKEVLQQKAANRRTAIAGMQAEFGEAQMPEFRRIMLEARGSRQPQAATPAQRTSGPGGAGGSWGEPDAGGWKIERVQ